MTFWDFCAPFYDFADDSTMMTVPAVMTIPVMIAGTVMSRVMYSVMRM